MTVLEILIAARAKIAKPENWTKGSGARDSRGNACRAMSALAVCWCAEGVVRAVESDFWKGHDAWEALKAAAGQAVYTFNDDPNTTHADVLAVFDKAIDAERNKTA